MQLPFEPTPLSDMDGWLLARGCAPVSLGLSALQARALLGGAQGWGFAGGDADAAGNAVGVLEQGRRASQLTVTLFGPPPGAERFWAGLEDFARRHAVTQLLIESVHREPASRVPPWRGESSRYVGERLYVSDLSEPEAAPQHSNTRRNIKRARAAGATLIDLEATPAWQAHLRLTGASIERRRQRGEDVALRASQARVQRLLASGHGRLWQAGIGTEVLSSKFVYRLGRHAYYLDGGTTARGMEAGLSHFLMDQTLQGHRALGCVSFNMGIARAGNDGLIRFKEGFGPQLWFVERVLVDRSHPWRQLRNLLRLR